MRCHCGCKWFHFKRVIRGVAVINGVSGEAEEMATAQVENEGPFICEDCGREYAELNVDAWRD